MESTINRSIAPSRVQENSEETQNCTKAHFLPTMTEQRV